MRRFKFYKNMSDDDVFGSVVMEDVFFDHIEAWKGMCVVLGITYDENTVRSLIAQGYYCTTEMA